MQFHLYVTKDRDASGIPVIRRQVSIEIPVEVNLWLLRRNYFIADIAEDVMVCEETGLHECSYPPVKGCEALSKELLDVHEGNGFDFEDVSAAKLLAALLKEFPITHYDVS
jgi:hypothetical protein